MKGLGARIKVLRKMRKMTLVEVAKKTAIDQATLSRIENGIMTGTLESHMRIAEALSIRLPDLYSEVIEKITDAKEQAVKKKLETFSHSTGVVAELLTTGILQKKMMPVLLKLKAKGRTAPEAYPPLTERFIYVLRGSLEISVDKESKILSQGESLYFDAALEHHFRNARRSEAWCLSVLTPTSL